jgi:predicted permease
MSVERGAGVRPWFRLRPRSAESVARQVEEEIALHIELRTRDLIAHGMPAEAARAEAEERFGPLERARLILRRAATERERRMSLREWLAGWAQDFRYSARALSRERLLAVVIVLTLALGLGANTIMFGIVDHLLLRGPEHVVDAEQVQRVYVTQKQWTGYGTSAATGYITYTLLRDNTTSFDGVAAYRTLQGRIGRGEAAREVPVGWSTADMFPLLGVQPRLGRFYNADEDRPRDPGHVAVLDHDFWQSEFGGATNVLGRTVPLDDVEYTVIGVSPRGFTGPERKPVSMWLPLSTGYKPHPEWPTTWNARWLGVITRTKAGISRETAAAEATVAFRAAAEGHNEDAAAGVLSLRPLRYGSRGEEPAEVAVTRWLLGVSVIVLLIAVANVMNLLLARVLRRRREVAVRLALGISRGRLARLLLSESMLLALFGLVGALVLTYWGGQAVRMALMPEVQWGAPLGGRMILFGAAATLITGLLIGLAPVLQSGRQDLTRGLRSGAAESGGRRAFVRGALTVVQAAFSVVLLVGAGLFVRSLWNVSRLDLGIDADRVLAVWTEFAATDDGAASDKRPASGPRQEAFFHEALAHLRAQPGVEGAVLALGTPLQGAFGVSVRVPGLDSIPEMPGGGPFITAASPGYFETVGTEIIRGRGFEEGEGRGTEPVAVVSETMARTLWPGEDALTKCLMIGDEDRVTAELFDAAPCARVVGIAENAHRFGIRQEPMMQYYIPFGQELGIGGTQIVVRPRGDPVAYIPELRRVLHALDPSITYLAINPLQSVLDPQTRPWRLGATMFLVFGALALVIAAVGLYSVMAYGVAQRRTEIGVRMALGARARTIIGMVVRQGVGLVLVGVLIGGALALASGPQLEPLLFETAGRDALVVATVAAVLGAVALLASIIPAARAGRTDPLQALRSD